MARLRFPGRPGQRFGRSLIRFMPEEARNSRNRFFNLTANIQKNLRAFYDLFGDSDEEDNFPGFTTHDIGVPEDKELSEAFDDGDFSPLFEVPTAASLHRARQSIAGKSFEANFMAAVDRSGKRLKTAGRRSYLDMHRGTTGGQPRKVIKKVEEVTKGKGALNKVKNIKMKAKDKIPSVMGQKAGPGKTADGDEKDKKTKMSQSIRFRFKLMRGGKRAKIFDSPEKRAAKKTSPVDKKTARKNRAKELLAKARQRKVQDSVNTEGKRNVKMSRRYSDMMVTGVADMHFLHRTTSPPPGERLSTSSRKSLSPSPSPIRSPRQFVLPQKSSRSSRVIKPSKRFIEEMGTSLPPKKQPKFDIAMDITHGMKQELLSSGDEFISPDKGHKTLLKQKQKASSSLESSSDKDTFVKPKSTKVVSTKVKKHSDKHFKASKKLEAGGDAIEEDVEILDAEMPEGDGSLTAKSSKVFKLKSEKRKALEKKKKEKLKAKKKKLQEKKEKAKQKKLEAKKKKKAKLLAKKKKKLKKSKSPKKKKAQDGDKEKVDEMEVGDQVEKADEAPQNEKPKEGAIIPERTEIVACEAKTEEKKNEAGPSKSPKRAKSPRRIRKVMKKKLKEEAKLLKKTYTELKQSIEQSERSAKVEGEAAVPLSDEALQRKKRLKELAKRHKEVCKALRKFQKEAVAAKQAAKEGKKKKRDGQDGDTLTYKIIEGSTPEREQKENLGPLRSPSELVKTGILTDASSSKAIAAFVNRQMAEAMEADMSPEQAKAANQREMKRRRQQLKEQSKKSQSSSRGPRIKHVSRRASVALGYSPVMFTGVEEGEDSPVSDFALSALSPMEKRKLLEPAGTIEKARWSSDDDGAKADENDEDFIPSSLKKRSTFRRSRPLSKKHPFGPKKFKPLKRLKKPLQPAIQGVPAIPGGLPALPGAPGRSWFVTRPKKGGQVLRRGRCGQCEGCMVQEDCTTCSNCLDKPKYGGPGTKKQCCMYRKCLNLKKNQTKKKHPPLDYSQHPMYQGLTRTSARKSVRNPTNSPKAGSLISELTSFDRVLVLHPASPATSDLSTSPVSAVGSLVPGPSSSGPAGPKIKRPSAQGVAKSMLLRNNKKKGVIKEMELRRESPSPPPPKLKMSIQQELSKHLIKIDFQEDYDLDIAWMRGLAIISSQPMIPRTVCYLCASTGKHDLIYCNICCEPFHEFCLDYDDRPLEGDLDKWCCRSCKFCSVCGRQDHLLTCAKCQTSYHAECLGPNYPTKPSKRRKIWLCTKCVKCKSCGATTPGQHSSAQWSDDFSLCQDCGKLFEKGNYCPICRKCYEDDDYESKMMECGKCKSWVHAKCEGLTDDMYHIMTDLPETVPYDCVVCDPVRPAKWQIELAEEMQAGFLNVMTAIFACRSASHLIWPDKRRAKSRSKSSTDSSRRSTASPALSDATSRSRSSTPVEGSGRSSTPLEGRSTTPVEGPCSRSTTPLEGIGRSITPLEDSSRSATPLDGIGRSSTPLEGSCRSTTPQEGMGRSTTPLVVSSRSTTPQEGMGRSSTPLEGSCRSSTPQEGSCDNDVQNPVRTTSTSSVKSDSPVPSTPTGSENLQGGIDSKNESTSEVKEQMTITVKQEALDEQLQQSENTAQSGKPSVKSDEVITIEDDPSDNEGASGMEVDDQSTESSKPCELSEKSDTSTKVDNEQSRMDTSESVVQSESDIPDNVDAPKLNENVESVEQSKKDAIECVDAEKTKDNSQSVVQSGDPVENLEPSQSDSLVSGDASGSKGQALDDRTKPPVDEATRTSTPVVPESSESVLASAELSETEADVKTIDEANTKDRDSRLECSGKDGDSLESSQSVNESKKEVEESGAESTPMQTENVSETDQKEVKSVVESSRNESDAGASSKQDDTCETVAVKEKVDEEIIESEQGNNENKSLSIPSSDKQTKVDAPNVDTSEMAPKTEERVAEEESTSAEPMETNSVERSTDSVKKSTDAVEKSTDSVEKATEDAQPKTSDNQPPVAMETSDPPAEQPAPADTSFTDSLEGAADLSATPGSLDRSRSESRDSAPETDITEAIHGQSRRVTRLSLLQAKNPQAASHVAVSRRTSVLPMSSPPAVSNVLLPSGGNGGALGDATVMSIIGTVIDGVMQGQSLTSLVVNVTPTQNRIQPWMLSPEKAFSKPQEDTDMPKDFQMIKAKVQAGIYQSIVSIKPQEDKDMPKDFQMIKAKVQAGTYQSIVSIKPQEDKDMPKDFQMIKAKVQAGTYQSIVSIKPQEDKDMPKDFQMIKAKVQAGTYQSIVSIKPQEDKDMPKDFQMIKAKVQAGTYQSIVSIKPQEDKDMPKDFQMIKAKVQAGTYQSIVSIKPQEDKDMPKDFRMIKAKVQAGTYQSIVSIKPQEDKDMPKDFQMIKAKVQAGTYQSIVSIKPQEDKDMPKDFQMIKAKVQAGTYQSIVSIKPQEDKDMPKDFQMIKAKVQAGTYQSIVSIKPQEDKDMPKDFQMIKAKVQAGTYQSINEFCNDCVRIIQSSMSRETSQTVRKNNRVARTVFTKVMEKMFPWFNVGKSSSWELSVKYPDGMLPDAVLPPHRDHAYAQWKQRGQHIPSTLQPSPLKNLYPPGMNKISDSNSEASDSNRTETPPPDPSIEDLRRCSLCGQYSDDDPNNAGRLLYCGQNDWIHINCALWSAEVFEEVDGSLINVHTAISRGAKLRCDFCHKTGATVGCCTPNCPANYHFMCARRINALFQEDKKVFCARHCRMVRKKLVDNDMFAVLRRVCVSFESMKMNRHFSNGIQVNRINFMVGSLTLDSLGRLGPLSVTKESLFPIDYKMQRVFWSTHDPRRRCVYTIRITEFKPDKIAKPCIVEETNLTTLHDPTFDANEFKSRMLLKTVESLSSSFPSARKRRRISSDNKLSHSWPRQNSAGLSEKTLKNLPQTVVREMSTPSPSTTSPSPGVDEDEGDLTDNLNKIVMSLNDAAAKSHKEETMETTSDPNVEADNTDSDAVEAINIELDEESVEKLIGEALSADQSLDDVLFVENWNNAISDKSELGAGLGQDTDDANTDVVESSAEGEKPIAEETSTEGPEETNSGTKDEELKEGEVKKTDVDDLITVECEIAEETGVGQTGPAELAPEEKDPEGIDHDHDNKSKEEGEDLDSHVASPSNEEAVSKSTAENNEDTEAEVGVDSVSESKPQTELPSVGDSPSSESDKPTPEDQQDATGVEENVKDAKPANNPPTTEHQTRAEEPQSAGVESSSSCVGEGDRQGCDVKGVEENAESTSDPSTSKHQPQTEGKKSPSPEVDSDRDHDGMAVEEHAEPTSDPSRTEHQPEAQREDSPSAEVEDPSTPHGGDEDQQSHDAKGGEVDATACEQSEGEPAAEKAVLASLSDQDDVTKATLEDDASRSASKQPLVEPAAEDEDLLPWSPSPDEGDISKATPEDGASARSELSSVSQEDQEECAIQSKVDQMMMQEGDVLLVEKEDTQKDNVEVNVTEDDDGDDHHIGEAETGVGEDEHTETDVSQDVNDIKELDEIKDTEVPDQMDECPQQAAEDLPLEANDDKEAEQDVSNLSKVTAAQEDFCPDEMDEHPQEDTLVSSKIDEAKEAQEDACPDPQVNDNLTGDLREESSQAGCDLTETKTGEVEVHRQIDADDGEPDSDGELHLTLSSSDDDGGIVDSTSPMSDEILASNGSSEPSPEDKAEREKSVNDIGESKGEDLVASPSRSLDGLDKGETAAMPSTNLPDGRTEEHGKMPSRSPDALVDVETATMANTTFPDVESEVLDKLSPDSVVEGEAAAMSINALPVDESIELDKISSNQDNEEVVVDTSSADDHVPTKDQEIKQTETDPTEDELKSDVEDLVVDLPEAKDSLPETVEDKTAALEIDAKEVGVVSQKDVGDMDPSNEKRLSPSVEVPEQVTNKNVEVNNIECSVNVFDILKKTKDVHQAPEETTRKTDILSPDDEIEVEKIIVNHVGTSVNESRRDADNEFQIQKGTNFDPSDESDQVVEDGFHTPTSSPSKLDKSITKTPVVVLHDLRQLSCDSMPKEAQIDPKDNTVVLSKVDEEDKKLLAEMEDLDSRDDDFIIEILSDSNDEEPSGMLANMLEDVLPKEVKKKGRDEGFLSDILEGALPKEVKSGDGVRRQLLAPEKGDNKLCNNESESYATDVGRDERAMVVDIMKRVLAGVESLPEGNKQSVQEASKSKIEAGDGSKDESKQKHQEETDDDVIEISDDDDDVAGEGETTNGKSTIQGKLDEKESDLAKESSPEVEKDSQSEDRNVFNIVPSRDTPVKQPASKESSSPASKESSSPVVSPQDKKDPQCVSPNWKSALKRFKKNVHVDLKIPAKGTEGEEMSSEKEGEAVTKTTGEEDPSGIGEERSRMTSPDEHGKRRYRRQSESLTDFDDFVPESNLDMIDISQPGRKKYPMRSTVRRLLRVAETTDGDQKSVDGDKSEGGQESRSRTPSGASSVSRSRTPSGHKTADGDKLEGGEDGRSRSPSGQQTVDGDKLEGGEESRSRTPSGASLDQKTLDGDKSEGRQEDRSRTLSGASSVGSGSSDVKELPGGSGEGQVVKRKQGRQLGWRKQPVEKVSNNEINEHEKEAVSVDDKEETTPSGGRRRSSRITTNQEKQKEIEKELEKQVEERKKSESNLPKKGHGRPRKNPVPEDEAPDTGRTPRARTPKGYQYVEDSSDEDVEDADGFEAEDHSEAAEEEQEEMMLSRQSVRKSSRNTRSASGRTLKAKIDTDFVQFDDDSQTDEDDFISEEDDPPPKPKGRSKKPKRSGSLSWRKDSEWSPNMENDTAASKKKWMKSSLKHTKSPEWLKKSLAQCKPEEQKALRKLAELLTREQDPLPVTMVTKENNRVGMSQEEGPRKLSESLPSLLDTGDSGQSKSQNHIGVNMGSGNFSRPKPKPVIEEPPSEAEMLLSAIIDSPKQKTVETPEKVVQPCASASTDELAALVSRNVAEMLIELGAVKKDPPVVQKTLQPMQKGNGSESGVVNPGVIPAKKPDLARPKDIEMVKPTNPEMVSPKNPEMVTPKIAETVTPTKAVCVPRPRTTPILLSRLRQKPKSPEIIEIPDDRPENTTDTKPDQVFIPMLSPISAARGQLPTQQVMSPPQTPKSPKMPALQRSPIVSPTHPLPPPRYYTIVQPATKEILSQPPGNEASMHGPSRIRGRIRMRGGRQPVPATSPYLCQTRLNRPQTMQVIPTLSPLHQMQSLQNKVLVQKNVLNDARFVVSGSSLQPIQQVLAPAQPTRTIPTMLNRGPFRINNSAASIPPINNPAPFQINPPPVTRHQLVIPAANPQALQGIVQQVPLATPVQTLQAQLQPQIQIISGNRALVQAPTQPLQVAASQPTIAMHVTVPQPAVINQPVILPQQRPQVVVSTVGGLVLPQVTTVSNIATAAGTSMLPNSAQLLASGVILNQGAAAHLGAVKSVQQIPPTTSTTVDRQHYASILQQYSNSMQRKSPPNNAVIQRTSPTNQLPSSVVTTIGVAVRGTSPPSVTVASTMPGLAPIRPAQHITNSARQPLSVATRPNILSPVRGSMATNMLNSLANQHLTGGGGSQTRPRILTPRPTINQAGIYGHLPSAGKLPQSESLPNHKSSTGTVKHRLETNEQLHGAKKRKTAHLGGSVWFDEVGVLHGATDRFSENELNEIHRTGEIPPQVSQIRTKMPSSSSALKARTKVPTFGPSKDLDRVVIGGGADGSGSQDQEGGIVANPSASRLRQHIVPKRRHDKWAAPPPSSSTRLPTSLADLESTEQSTVQSDVDQDEKMSLPPEEEEDEAPSILLQMWEKQRKKPKVEENKETEPHLVFEVTSDDGFSAKGSTMEEAWGKVIGKVEERRSDTQMTYLSYNSINPLKILGVSHDALVFLIEQLYGAKNCRDYKFKYHQYYDAELEEEPEINPSGAARGEQFTTRNYYDMFNFLASRHRKRPQANNAEQDETMHKSARRATSISDLPMAMRFRHLKETSKEAVGVYRSRIHGRGLFCKRTIDAGEMIIEYTGTVIRSVLTDKREKYYESKGIGCYMFRIDDYDVIDATMHGSAARFINHSCEPNCFSRVIQVGTSKHIVIFASRKIYTGEELTYDYKFPIEEDKIPCNCQAPRCRKYLN